MKIADRKVYQAIDDILWYEWDPIGINDNEIARDEYKGYTLHLFALKKQGADIFKITHHLYNLVNIDMSITGSEESIFDHCKIIAQKIIDL